MRRRLLWPLATLLLLGGAGCQAQTSCPKPKCAEIHVPVLTGAPIGYEGATRQGERIVVAERDLRAGTVLRTSLLKAVPRPARLAWKGHLRPVDLVHFSGLRLRRAVRAGQAILLDDLIAFPGGRTESGIKSRRIRVPAGTRAVSLSVSWVGGAGTWVRPGDYVDVGLVAKRGRFKRLGFRMLMQRARVVAAQPWGRDHAARRRMRWCTVLALPREAQGLALASRLGRIVIFPRGRTDRRRAVYQPVTRRDLENPVFWKRLEKQRLKTIRRYGLPDDPGIGTK